MGIFNRDDDRAQPAAFSVVRPLTASAQRIRVDDKGELEKIKKRKGADAWQTDAWEYFDAIGEIKYAGTLIGAVVSRVRLYPAFNVDPDQAPANMRDAAELEATDLPEGLVEASERILRRLDSANGGQSGLMNRAGINLWVAGECNLVQIPEKIGSGVPERWDIKSVDELQVGMSGGLSISSSRGGGHKEDLPLGSFAARIWRSHPRYSDEADSSLRAVRDLCDELLLLSRAVRATARSRLNAGAIYLPDGLSLAAEADEEVEIEGIASETVVETDDFEQELVDAMTTPISDEESASAVVPLIIRGPADLGDKIKQFKFERSFDPALAERAERILERILQGLDVPKDVVTGLANVKYSNAVQIDESLYKAHIEPLVLLIVDALTAIYFRPSLIAMGFPESVARKATLWYDPTEIMTRPDRAESANAGYDRKTISAEAWRRANGYAETDAPTPEEQIFREALNRGPMSPEVSEALFRIVAPALFGKVRDENIAASPSPFTPKVNDILQGGDGTPDPEVAGPPAPIEDTPPSQRPEPNATPAPAPAAPSQPFAPQRAGV